MDTNNFIVDNQDRFNSTGSRATYLGHDDTKFLTSYNNEYFPMYIGLNNFNGGAINSMITDHEFIYPDLRLIHCTESQLESLISGSLSTRLVNIRNGSLILDPIPNRMKAIKTSYQGEESVFFYKDGILYKENLEIIAILGCSKKAYSNIYPDGSVDLMYEGRHMIPYFTSLNPEEEFSDFRRIELVMMLVDDFYFERAYRTLRDAIMESMRELFSRGMTVEIVSKEDILKKFFNPPLLRSENISQMRYLTSGDRIVSLYERLENMIV